jgi:hypothetical protein
MLGVDKRRQAMNRKLWQSGTDSRRLIWRIAILCVVWLSVREASAQVTPQPFSADMVKTSSKKVTTAKVSMIQTAIRTEGVERGRKYITIMRYDRKVLWSLMPEQKMYVEMGMPPEWNWLPA